jgi:choline-sulfatase
VKSRILLALIFIAACRTEKPERPPIILISIDTLRSDHLPAYGYDKIGTPHLDAFRRDAVLFERAYAHAPLTLPSHASIFTGKLPPEHGVRNNIGYRLSADQTTLASRLRAHGYATGAAVSSWVLRGATGIGAGFDFYEDAIEQRGGVAVGSLQRPGSETIAQAERWLFSQGAKPSFLFLHLFEPHTPYEPTYDADIERADAILGSFFQHLKEREMYDRSLIIVLSDHGEGLGDHGEAEHGIFLYRESIQVPLMIKLPNGERAGSTISRPLGLVEVFPTVLSLAGERDTPSLLDDRSPAPIYSETYYPRIHLGWSELRSLVEGDRHFIEAPRPELYDLARDPAEKNNLAGEARRDLFAMKETLSRSGGSFQTPQNIDPEEAAKLAALGYLGNTTAAEGPLPDPKDRIDELSAMNEGAMLSREGKYAQAIERLRDVVSKNPQFTDAWTHLAHAYEESGDFANAAAAYERSIALAPAMAADKALPLAAILLNLNDLEGAKAHAELALAANEPGARILLGRVALTRRDLSAAAGEARIAANDPSSRPGALVLLAQVALAQKRFDEAMRLVAEAESLSDMPVPLIDYVRGEVHARSGRAAEAEAAFAREIEKFPHEREAYASLAVLQILQGKRAAAEATMERFVGENPGRANILFAARTFDEIGDAALAGRWRRRAGK